MIHGDCLEQLKSLAGNSVDSLVTDPPAGISFMGKEWDHNKGGREEWIAWMAEVMRECHRVLKPGAHGLVWAIPRTSHWTGTALEIAGFEVRDCVTHLFGSGFPKSLDISKAIDKAAGAERKVIGSKLGRPGMAKDGRNQRSGFDAAFQGRASGILATDITVPSSDKAKQWNGWGTALKPAAEFWWLVRKPCSEKTVAANVQKWGTGGINIDGSRIEAADQAALAKNWDRDQSASAEGNASGGMGLKAIDLSGRAPQGRFPANLVLSHTPYCTDEMCDLECAIKMLNEQSGSLKGPGNKKSTKGTKFFDSDFKARAIPGINLYPGQEGGVSRFFYCAKISSRERNDPKAPAIDKNSHPTVKPKKLMGYLINLITPPSGTVLDPFMGSGSTGIAAKEQGFQFIGIEKEQEYFEIAKARISAAEVG